ncbi:MAG: metalloregulator ArsR/SmtB family transcription factor [Acidimicrobiales bacterium]
MDDDDRFKALANETRRRTLRLVRDDAWPVGALAEELGVSQPAMSQHLAVLRDAGLVAVEVDGRRRLYRANDDGIRAAQRFFDDYWSSALDRLAEAAASEMRIRRAAS